MPFISYAENLEDVLLYRALRHLQSGSFVEIVSDDPRCYSVGNAFLTRGWSSTKQTYTPASIDVCALTTVFDRTGYSQTHFLRIDVAHAQEQLIKSGDWVNHRPWIVLIRSTKPKTNISEHEGWEPILLQHGYQFVWFDGINRYYLAEEHNDLIDAFQYPVNVLDDYTTYRETVLAEGRLKTILDYQALDDAFKVEMEKSKCAIADAVKAHENAVNVIHQLQAEIASIRRDPIVVFFIRLRKLRAKIWQSLKKGIKAALLTSHAIIQHYPGVKHGVSRSIKCFPSLYQHLQRLAGKPSSQSIHQERPLSVVLEMQPKGVRAFLAKINK